ncbi:rhodanese-like domain-containing protein [Pseudothauera lacus]|uniref:Sulfurtransferase n=1 Tax=Pseudothauera lacus TaxID=2136175 RepID=A0A2T4IE69_9RHOO|nr:rhodanese-like domain-containing protein [Pseudothauera lacus]PTD96063.1 sulfurtransferase [Pseudothauera lacus]
MLRKLIVAAALSAGLVSGMAAAADWSALPEIKRTELKLYLSPQEALEMKLGGGEQVLFLDVRTRAEAMYVGMATAVDALVPFVEHQEIMTDWDEQRRMYRLEPLQDFVPEVERRLAEKGLGKDATIILICRSGDRSSRAANRLQQAGYTRVYSVPEGFEGDRARDGAQKGQRVVNGWKNAGLPWSYDLDKARMYFPR